jgi:hypothetical protein
MTNLANATAMLRNRSRAVPNWPSSENEKAFVGRDNVPALKRVVIENSLRDYSLLVGEREDANG